MKNFAAAIGGTSLLALLCGVAYMVDCRASVGKNWDKAQGCYITGYGLMMGVSGVGATAAGAYQLGYNTYNPALRAKRPEEEEKRL